MFDNISRFLLICLFSTTAWAVDFDPPVLEAQGTSQFAVGDLGTFADDLAYLKNGVSQETYIQFASNSGLTGNLFWPAGDSDIRTGDFDGDGWGDLAVLESNTNLVYIRWGESLFSPDYNSISTYWSGGVNPVHLEVADMDGDGDDDWVVANSGNDVLGVGISNGRSFGISSFGAFNYSSFELGDITGDNAADIVVTADLHNHRNDSLMALVNDGNGNYPIRWNNGFFLQWVITDIYGIAPWWHVMADMDGDGRQDVIVAAVNNAHLVQVWTGNADGSFSFSDSVGMFGWVFSNGMIAETADVDGDGNMDLLMTPKYHDVIWYYPGDGAGNLGSRQVIDAPANGTIRDIGVGDFNNDGIPDIAYADGDLLVLYGL